VLNICPVLQAGWGCVDLDHGPLPYQGTPKVARTFDVISNLRLLVRSRLLTYRGTAWCCYPVGYSGLHGPASDGGRVIRQAVASGMLTPGPVRSLRRRQMSLELVISVVAVLVSLISFEVNRRAANAAERHGRMPVLTPQIEENARRQARARPAVRAGSADPRDQAPHPRPARPRHHQRGTGRLLPLADSPR